MKKTFLEWLIVLDNCKCHICGELNEEEWECEKCNEIYCENCSAPFTYHSPIDYNCCIDCATYHY